LLRWIVLATKGLEMKPEIPNRPCPWNGAVAKALYALLSLLELDGSLALSAVRVDIGRLSVYRPGDGWNLGELACGGRYTSTQVHLAHREWRRLGCGRSVYVCAHLTGRCVLTRVMDAGPWGIYRGPIRNAVPDGRWRIWANPRPPKGWRFRALADLSWALWKQLGRPRGLSEVTLYILPRGWRSPELRTVAGLGGER